MKFAVKFHDALDCFTNDDRMVIIEEVIQEWLDNTGLTSYFTTYNGQELFVSYIDYEAYVMPNNEEATQFTYWKLQKEGKIKVFQV